MTARSAHARGSEKRNGRSAAKDRERGGSDMPGVSIIMPEETMRAQIG